MADTDTDTLLDYEHQHSFLSSLSPGDSEIPKFCCSPQTAPQLEYRPQTRRRVALVLVLLCHFSTWSAGSTMAIWFPNIVDTKGTYDFVAPLLIALFFSIGWISGIITDSCVPRKMALNFSLVFCSATLIACLMMMKFANEVSQESNSTTDESIKFKKFQLAGHYTDGFFVMLIVGCVTMSLGAVSLPTLGSDQIPDGEGVRLFYAVFYFTRMLSEIFSFSITFICMTVQSITPWIIVASTCVLSGLILTWIVTCPFFTRQVQANTSILTHGCGICVQALKNKRKNQAGKHIFSAAARSNGGDYPDEEVKERVSMMKFALMVVILLPSALTTSMMEFGDISYHTNETDCGARGSSETFLPGRYGTVSINYIIIYTTSAVCTILLYSSQYLLVASGRLQERSRLTFMSKFIIGYIFTLLASFSVLLGYCLEVCSHYYEILPYLLIGVGYAFIMTSAYELAFISAPRSLQGTAMGMFYLIEGIGQTLFLLVAEYIPSFGNNSSAKWLFGCVGVGGNIIGLTMLVIANRSVRLELRTP